jgi:hypothetical protein
MSKIFEDIQRSQNVTNHPVSFPCQSNLNPLSEKWSSKPCQAALGWSGKKKPHEAALARHETEQFRNATTLW